MQPTCFMNSLKENASQISLPKEVSFYCLVVNSCLTLCGSMDYSLPGSIVHEHWRIDPSEFWCWRRLLRQQGDQTSQSLRKSALDIHRKDWYWNWSSNTLAIWCDELTHWKRPWCWEKLKAGGEVGIRGWDVWRHHQLNGMSLSKL